MHEKTISWYKVSGSEEALSWQPNQMCIAAVAGKTLTLARYGAQLYAFAHLCPHAGGCMAEGYINAAGQVTCPLHSYRFDIRTGRNTSGEGYFLKTFAVEKKPDGIYVQLEDSAFGSPA